MNISNIAKTSFLLCGRGAPFPTGRTRGFPFSAGLPAFCGLMFFAAGLLNAEIQLAPLFSDGAVLQQGKPIPVWGWSEPRKSITVHFGSQEKQAKADAEGKWMVRLDPLAGSAEGAAMRVSDGSSERVIRDIVVGEVWLCSGQSNMELPVSKCLDAENEVASANFPMIREFRVPRNASQQAQNQVAAEWRPASPQTVKDFTAVGYFFAREIHAQLKVPVGLINASWGGSPIEPWIAPQDYTSEPPFSVISSRWKQIIGDYPKAQKQYEEETDRWKRGQAEAQAAGRTYTGRKPRRPLGPGQRNTPSALYNGMIHPFVPCGLAGFLWYQGEANAVTYYDYSALFRALITGWRRDFQQGNLPFLFVQLANFNRGEDEAGPVWAYLREAQATVLDLPATGMVVTCDIGTPNNIHPPNKQEVGRRLARIALEDVYHRSPGPSRSPAFASATREGGALRIKLSETHGAMKLQGDMVKGFEIAGPDKIYYPAQVTLDGETLVVSASQVSDPAWVRFGWKNSPEITLFNKAGLPLAPFRYEPSLSSTKTQNQP